MDKLKVTISKLVEKVKDLESRLIFLEELGLEKLVNQHHRDQHQREILG